MIYRAVTTIRKDHQEYLPGSEIELTDKQAMEIAHAISGPISVEVQPIPQALVVEVLGVLREAEPAVSGPLLEIQEDPATIERVSSPMNRGARKAAKR